MALPDGTWESGLREHFSLLSVASAGDGDGAGLLGLSDEVLVLVLRELDPRSLLRLGSTCVELFRVASCDSLWTRHFRTSFGVPYVTGPVSAKEAFRLLFMWKALFTNLHCNRVFQERLLPENPLHPHKYWVQWLVLEENVPLPSVRLPCDEIEALWGIDRGLLEKKLQEKSGEGFLLRFEWKELHGLALLHHGGAERVHQHVLDQHKHNDHGELERLYAQYSRCRFQWLFTFWLFRQPPAPSRQLRCIYLQWKRHDKRKVSSWGETLCDVHYLASLHHVTADYWRGHLAQGDEAVGIQTVDNYFSMCKSLVAWVLGRDWGKLKRRKVYEDTLTGVYLLLRREMRDRLVERERFWAVAKVQMSRVCALEEAALNYANWRMVETLPYYKLFLISGNSIYLDHVQGFLRRKRLIQDWIYQDENTWAREALAEELFSLLQFHTKISQDGLHGDSVTAQLSRLVWLFLHSGQQMYLDGVKEMVFRFAQESWGCYHALSPAAIPDPGEAR
ncbi:uncharacterized protein LOC114763635 [Denticeps clupeoides]|uniref:F-box domain-containing protein n=1 Tax=Denticeps clupeoides TaxID=299321 RepID=A0AAY4AXT7_9TELE|nr:uncharacterized protein LOC114763635 [Denticeps clupeoides]